MPVIALLLSALIAAGPSSRYVLASVIHTDGQPALGLGADDFVVREAEQPRTPLNVVPANYPVALLIDTSAWARADFMTLRSAANWFVGMLSGRDVALYTFGDRAQKIVDFTRQTSRLERALDSITAAGDAQPHAFDAIVEAAAELHRRETPISMIVVLAAGGDDRSDRPPLELERALGASHSVLRVVDLRVARSMPPMQARGRRPDSGLSRISGGEEGLFRRLAAATTGRYDRIFAPGGYREGLEALRTDLASEVVLEYEVPGGAASGPLQLGLRLPGTIVRAIGLDRPIR